MPVAWLNAVSGSDIDTAGGKGASLGELRGAGLPVPSAFIVTADTYRTFIDEAGITKELFEAVDVDSEDSTALASAEQHARELIMNTEWPDSVRETILDAYADFGDDPFVAVRSSATAEDLPDASFAGQQETFLNVDREALLDQIKRCWGSLFTQRAIYYRDEQGFDHENVDIAVVVQRMVDADKSGVMFTSHPSTGDSEIVVEGAWGLGEAVVSGSVSPDNYIIDKESGEIEDVTVTTKKIKCVRDAATGETVEKAVETEQRDERVLDEDELDELRKVGRLVEDHYGDPQDVEWAIADGDVYMLQSRPITTIDESTNGAASTDGDSDGELLVSGLGASPGTVSGRVRSVGKLDHLDAVTDGDIIVAEMTTPDMVPAMKRASAIVTDEGGMTSHAAIISRELGVPAVIGTESATATLADDQYVTVDGDKGTVVDGAATEAELSNGQSPAGETGDPGSSGETTASDTGRVPKPMTATEVKVNVSIPEAAERAAASGADGVGLLRIEHMVLSLGKTPEKYIADHGDRAFRQEIIDGIRTVAEEFYPRPVRARTLDAPSDEFRQLAGGEDEPTEHNPMLGYRGIRRSLDKPAAFELQLEAVRRLHEMGYDNVELMFPLVTDAEDVLRAKSHMQNVGIDPDKRRWGVMIETPASALSIEEIADAGVDFVSFGTNDLTQYTLAVDRNNSNVADRYDELHPAVRTLMTDVIETCRANDVDTSICGQAASKPAMVQALVNAGITSLSPNVDAVRDVQQEVKRVEQKLLVDTIR
ncbi:phosphoenolpyruvate synthase [Haloarcula mannanilytica]|uniref:Phosphoenolpyruvate synthase n=1 Tax=Haloarcula mannanilytica TaxID=2509225 RepID=A0A4C2ETT6_9EURY|nr:phosphoenolpyruvate synthase [Haloarcula mannanilytica]GCF16033.1 phosphoenolpyruvate synthase [Haloarcula mannanilytica]